jgi:diadenosine tetraphosphate (Ap4A) HIT family hydrolase
MNAEAQNHLLIPKFNGLASLADRDVGSEAFGGKAAALSAARAAGATVAEGFCLSAPLAEQIWCNALERHRRDLLSQAFDAVRHSSPIGRVIVRSSHIDEGGNDPKLSGAFKSVADIETFEDFVQAVAQVSQSSSERGVGGQEIGAELSCAHMPVLVQAQIDCDYSLLVSVSDGRALIELFSGNLASPISGVGIPTTVVGNVQDGFLTSAEVLSDAADLGETIALSLAASSFCALGNSASYSLAELGYGNGVWWLFQVQTFGQRWQTAGVEDQANPLSTETAVGTKAAAMDYFQARGLFDKRLLVLASGNKNLTPNEFSNWSPPLTVRFSSGARIGLPRLFTESAEHACAVVNGRDPRWSAIVHEFLSVTRSFELLLEPSRLYLEHVPGLWESKNETQPDALIIDLNGQCRAFRTRFSRTSHSGTSVDEGERTSEPVARQVFREWAARISDIAVTLRADFESRLPLNFHFVEDTDGRWQFLNIRNGFRPSNIATIDRQTAHSVSTIEDLRDWDGKSPIEVRISIERGKEAGLASLAIELRKLRVPIYASFGFLSHPAIVLQAHGVKLLPSYLMHTSASDESDYDEFEFSLDRGLDPIERIEREPALYVNDKARAVLDAEPISSNHVLVVAKEPFACFADMPSEIGAPGAVANSSALQHLWGKQGWLFYERGRAKFCTSGFTDQRAHYHLLPLKHFVSNLLPSLIDATKAMPFPNFEAAAKAAAEVSGEYLMFGTSAGDTYLVDRSNQPLAKRFMREFLTRNLK